ncbi:hypothetical protein CEQ28_000415 [Hafnia alvei]|nr:hypothetical protein CEQ28_000415 [Hafnia alvei]
MNYLEETHKTRGALSFCLKINITHIHTSQSEKLNKIPPTQKKWVRMSNFLETIEGIMACIYELGLFAERGLLWLLIHAFMVRIFNQLLLTLQSQVYV